MAPDGTEPQTGRETRLLVLVVGVAVLVLLLLAQWQFPGSTMSVVTPGGAPLAGLAARATFDEMAGTMADVIGRVSPLTVAVPLATILEPDPRDAAPVRRQAPAPATTPDAANATPVPEAWTLALRVRRDLALAYVPGGLTVMSREGATFDVVAHDGPRGMWLLRVPPSNAVPDTLSASVRTFPNFSYVAAVTATPVGPTVQPVFVGRSDTVTDPGWSHALVPASVAPGVSPGTLVFSLNSRLIGIVVDGERGPMIVPAPAIETLVQALDAPEGTTP